MEEVKLLWSRWAKNEPLLPGGIQFTFGNGIMFVISIKDLELDVKFLQEYPHANICFQFFLLFNQKSTVYRVSSPRWMVCLINLLFEHIHYLWKLLVDEKCLMCCISGSMVLLLKHKWIQLWRWSFFTFYFPILLMKYDILIWEYIQDSFSSHFTFLFSLRLS